MRRRRPVEAQTADGIPVRLLACRIHDWTSTDDHDLECHEDGRCKLTGTGDHDEWCPAFTARRRWYRARAALPDTPIKHRLPHTSPIWGAP